VAFLGSSCSGIKAIQYVEDMNPHFTKIHKQPTIRRLPSYLYFLRELSEKGEQFVSSSYIAKKMQIEPILVRKDLESTLITGTPGVGYHISDLIKCIEDFLGWDKALNAVLVGVDHFGLSLLGHRELINFGLRIVAAFDNQPRKCRTSFLGVPIYLTACIEELLRTFSVDLAILCVPAKEAQAVTDMLVASGIKAIWNFTSENLAIPDTVITQKEDLASGLAMLSVKLTMLDERERLGTIGIGAVALENKKQKLMVSQNRITPTEH